jgi:hypothetical protein
MQARNFMIGDIQKSIELAELKYPDGTTKGAPNILIALGLSCYTEYWGKLLLGLPREREKSRTCYEEFLKCLGDSYESNPYQELLSKGLPIYEDVRCGLVHAYAVSRDCTVNLGEDRFGICYDEIRDHYDFNVKTYFREFKYAVDAYIDRLNNGTKSILKMNNAIKGKPLIL